MNGAPNQPIRNLQMMLRGLAQQDKRYRMIFPDGHYSNETMLAVSQFQKLHHLDVTGITDLATWEAIVAAFRAIREELDAYAPLLIYGFEEVEPGASHPDIWVLQSVLRVLANGYFSIPSVAMTGVLDGATIAAIKTFQTLAKLPADGKPTKTTWHHLTRHYPTAARRAAQRMGGVQKGAANSRTPSP